MPETQWQAHVRAYNEQKRLEQYQQNRILITPKTTKAMVGGYVAILVAIYTGLSVVLFVVSPLQQWVNLLIFVLCIVGVTETYGRFLGIKVVECYQHYATEATRRKCKCVPSCSEYAVLCLKKYGLIKALLKIKKRLFVTCKGFAYILDDP